MTTKLIAISALTLAMVAGCASSQKRDIASSTGTFKVESVGPSRKLGDGDQQGTDCGGSVALERINGNQLRLNVKNISQCSRMEVLDLTSRNGRDDITWRLDGQNAPFKGEFVTSTSEVNSVILYFHSTSKDDTGNEYKHYNYVFFNVPAHNPPSNGDVGLVNVNQTNQARKLGEGDASGTDCGGTVGAFKNGDNANDLSVVVKNMGQCSRMEVLDTRRSLRTDITWRLDGQNAPFSGKWNTNPKQVNGVVLYFHSTNKDNQTGEYRHFNYVTFSVHVPSTNPNPNPPAPPSPPSGGGGSDW